ncbi:LysM peptidoglycan-binding domain-containing protein [bacterium]|jgi:LysM repeat protein|nr:LysM peptidoglycan-binding domain-containing protein [bacterium]MBP9809738.1 LysM peptidoglycan-binding domain-containing protein [bacterium]
MSDTDKSEDTSESPATYKVVPGDNLWNISRTLLAAKNGKEPSNQEIMAMVNQFVSLNAIVNRDLIYPDQVLKIPQV